jgi:hypothetical protein
LSPTDWKLTFDGESITLYPSIGNWSFPCQSHYWITGDRIEWARPMSRTQIEGVRMADRARKAAQFDSVADVGKGEPTEHAHKKRAGWLKRVFSRESRTS